MLLINQHIAGVIRHLLDAYTKPVGCCWQEPWLLLLFVAAEGRDGECC